MHRDRKRRGLQQILQARLLAGPDRDPDARYPGRSKRRECADKNGLAAELEKLLGSSGGWAHARSQPRCGDDDEDRGHERPSIARGAALGPHLSLEGGSRFDPNSVLRSSSVRLSVRVSSGNGTSAQPSRSERNFNKDHAKTLRSCLYSESSTEAHVPQSSRAAHSSSDASSACQLIRTGSFPYRSPRWARPKAGPFSSPKVAYRVRVRARLHPTRASCGTGASAPARALPRPGSCCRGTRRFSSG